LYEVPEIKNKCNKLYIAAIQKNNMSDSKLLYKNTPDNSISPFELWVIWSKDSKSLVACKYHKNNKVRTGYRKYTIEAPNSN
jgi:hypothetical protein